MPVAPSKPRTSSTNRRPRRTSSKRVPRQMDTNPVAYWNEQAKDYDENIFSTIDEDTTKVITRTLDMYANKEEGPRGRCVDLGCGAGKYLPALASRFRHVVGYDLSPKLVHLARKEAVARGATNVEVGVRDLSKVWFVGGKATPRAFASGSDFVGDVTEMESYGFAVMANVLIAPVSDHVRTVMLENAYRALCPGGKLLAVVPSMESALYVNMRCAETNCASVYDVIISPTQSQGADLIKGIVPRSGVRTKHFLEAEFRFQAESLGFSIESLAKVEYTWRSELGLNSDLVVPTRLRQTPGPLPWDWLFVLRKPGRRGSRLEEEGQAANSEAACSLSAYANTPATGRYVGESMSPTASSPSSGQASTAAASSKSPSSYYSSPPSSSNPSKPSDSRGSTPTLPPVQPSIRQAHTTSASQSASRLTPTPPPSSSPSPVPTAAEMRMATSSSRGLRRDNRNNFSGKLPG
eukprot:CAMPEP_0206589374 /NCGR_PEP_ID=MMETSP0325_2-20121206/38876_1 /ASSEMBLY_ACC=CAM_ASM_000347 /TAXON_ID=2866 /ORGANISM="Crypthecodinium cohnii, Strain Seligo" /LENGTH=464 /DNA_ID=CAMNT_0054097903 /DNA_START=127 /DNA_END=1517 /DNA_ORIENTATION=-